MDYTQPVPGLNFDQLLDGFGNAATLHGETGMDQLIGLRTQEDVDRAEQMALAWRAALKSRLLRSAARRTRCAPETTLHTAADEYRRLGGTDEVQADNLEGFPICHNHLG